MHTSGEMLVERPSFAPCVIGIRIYHTLSELSAKLVAHGKPGSTPTAIVSKGTSSQQQVLTGTLDTIAELQRKAQLPAPALIIVGEVVNMHENLSWFGDDLVADGNHSLMKVHHGVDDVPEDKQA